MDVSSFCRQVVARLLLIAGAAAAPAWASEPLDTATLADQPVSLTAFIGVLEDPERTLTVADVQRPEVASRFQSDLPASSALGLGFTRSAYWLRVPLRNTSAHAVERMLAVENPRISHIQAYLPDGHGAFKTVITGSDVPASRKAYPNRNFIFPITVAAQADQVIYLRMESTVGLLIPLHMWTPEAYHAHERDDYAGQAWYFGIATAMILFNLMLFLSLRDRIYLLYIAFATCTFATLAVKNGLAPDWQFGGVPLNSNVVYYTGTSLALAAMLLFMRRMLGTRQLLPRTDRLLLGMVALYLLTPLAYALALPVFSRAAILLNLATALVVVAVGVMAALKRQRSAYFFLAAFALLMLGGAMTSLRAMGVMPTNLFTVDGLQLGSAMEMLLLAFALADRYNVMRREKARVREQLLLTQQQLVQTLQSSERELEQRVAQRTEELQVLNTRLETLSLTDALTGIANRRHFDDVLAQEWTRAQRIGSPLALAIMDVDWFKLYNDHYGHPAGDACLQQIAHTLAATVSRSSDLVARYGGEEFVFLAPMTDAAGAHAMARKVVQAVAALGLAHARSPLGHVTISVGVVSVLPSPENTPHGLLQLADAALYEAKKQGRNSVGVH